MKFALFILLPAVAASDGHDGLRTERKGTLSVSSSGKLEAPAAADALTAQEKEPDLAKLVVRRVSPKKQTTATQLPIVSVLSIGNPMRRGFQWNVLTNFLKQDYAGPMELVFVDSETRAGSFDTRLSSHLVKEGMKAPTLIKDLGDIFGDDGHIPVKNAGRRFIKKMNASGMLGHLRNKGVEAASGSIIVGLDDDDVYDYSHVSHAVGMFQQFPEAMLVYSPAGAAQSFSMDNSVTTGGATYDAYGAGQHAFRKDAGIACPYGGVSATEEHALIDCIKKRWSKDSIMALSQKPSNGVGYIKVQWAGGVCANIWKSKEVIKQNEKASLKGYSNYVQGVLNNLHFLQKMNGGSTALEYLREAFPAVNIPFIPRDLISSRSLGTAAKCNQWDILVETSAETTAFKVKKSQMTLVTSAGNVSEDYMSLSQTGGSFQLRVDMK